MQIGVDVIMRINLECFGGNETDLLLFHDQVIRILIKLEDELLSTNLKTTSASAFSDLIQIRNSPERHVPTSVLAQN